MTALNEAEGQVGLVRLNLIFSPALEDAITEALMADQGLLGFTLLHAQGHTGDFSRASVREQIRGRVDRRVIWVLLEPVQLEGVLASLRQRIASRDVRWWVEPVLAGGRLV